MWRPKSIGKNLCMMRLSMAYLRTLCVSTCWKTTRWRWIKHSTLQVQWVWLWNIPLGIFPVRAFRHLLLKWPRLVVCLMMNVPHALSRSGKCAIFVVKPYMSVTAALLLTQSVIPVANEVIFHVFVDRRSYAVINQPNRSSAVYTESYPTYKTV